jgi:carbon monoxide dehydrogenase subunit G
MGLFNVHPTVDRHRSRAPLCAPRKPDCWGFPPGARSPYVMDYTGRFSFPVPPHQLWAAIERLDHFQRWWAWLGELQVDGPGLREGTVLRGTVSPPVPYRMRVEVELQRCVPGQLIDARVSGDLSGNAHLRLQPDGDATVTDVAWSLQMLSGPMRIAATFAHPLLRRGHDRVVDATVNGFRRQLQTGYEQ